MKGNAASQVHAFQRRNNSILTLSDRDRSMCFFAHSSALTPPLPVAEEFVILMLLLETLMCLDAHMLPVRGCWAERGSRKLSERHGTDLSKSASRTLQLVDPTLPCNCIHLKTSESYCSRAGGDAERPQPKCSKTIIHSSLRLEMSGSLA